MTVSACPKCDESVRIPAAHPEARVRCPFCNEEYLLSEALDTLPPLLELLDAPAAAHAMARHAAAAGEASSWQPAGDGGPAGAELDDEEFAAFGEEVAEEVEPDEYSVEPASDTAEDGEDRGGPFEFGGDEAAVSPSFTATPRPKPKQKSIVVEMIKIVGGGVAGIVLALLIMWWGIGTDPLKVAPTIAKYTPWIVPASLRGGADKESNSDDEATGPMVNNGGSKGGGKLNEPISLGDAFNKSQAGMAASGGNGGSAESADGGLSQAGGSLPDDSMPADDSALGGIGGLGEIELDPTISEPTLIDPTKDTALPDPSLLGPSAGLPALPGAPSDPTALPSDPTALPEPGTGGAPAATSAEATPDLPADPSAPASAANAAGIRNGKTISAQQLTAAIEKAQQCNAALDGSGDASRQKRQQLALDLYDALARLGEAVTLADPFAPTSQESLQTAQQTVQKIGGEDKKFRLIGILANRHLNAEQREHNGVLLSGTVKEINAAGRLFETRIELAGGRASELLSVLSRENPQTKYNLGSQVLILGAVVADPAQNLRDYRGDANEVICSGAAVVVPKASGAAKQ